MSPEPDPQSPADLNEKEYLSFSWQNLPWTPWVPFSADKNEFYEIPKEPGLYRIRPVGKDFLMYIGETKRTLHQRLHDLRMELRNRTLMPWSDPHAEAAALWAWQDAEGFEYECSAAPLDASPGARRGMESYLLYRYRQESQNTPLCNLGRFHPRYRVSTTKAEKLRGGKLEAGQQDNPAGGPSLPPLPATGIPGDPDWMGLSWSSHESLNTAKSSTTSPGLYILIDAGLQEIIFIGKSETGGKRLLDPADKTGEGKEVEVSFHTLEKTLLPYQIRELETDLIGNFYEQYRKAPELQFRNSR